jgi:hypothetical protein
VSGELGIGCLARFFSWLDLKKLGKVGRGGNLGLESRNRLLEEDVRNGFKTRRWVM